MKILIAGSECAPYLKSGGLGDVLGALPISLAKAGHEVKLFLPFYRDMKGLPKLRRLFEESISVTSGKARIETSVLTGNINRSSLELILIDQPQFFDREGLYLDTTGKVYPDNDDRYIGFCEAVLQTCRRMNFRPDVIHAHDWQTALLPVFVRARSSYEEISRDTRTVLTIHNLAYQGSFDAPTFEKLDVDDSYFLPAAPFEFYGKVNFLKAGIVFADHLTTVSPTYAREIQSNGEFGCGLEGVLKQRADSLTGILNGVDYSVWSPSRDSHIPYRYHVQNLSGKRATKVELLNSASLPIRDSSPLVGIISRLVDQKGFDLIEEGADDLFSRDLQFILLGTGQEKYHRLFSALEQKYPDKCRAFLTFDDQLAHLIEAGADIFLMPSQFEPCGLNQIYSLKYGTVPIVRKTGGLADTVEDFDETTGSGTGFVFEPYNSSAMLDAIDRALALFPRKRAWTKLMKSGMAVDNSWSKVARRYETLYSTLCAENKVPCA